MKGLTPKQQADELYSRVLSEIKRDCSDEEKSVRISWIVSQLINDNTESASHWMEVDFELRNYFPER